MSDKIINTFQQRRQLEQAMADFAHTQNETELAAAARRIVFGYPPDLVLTLLIKHLDTPDSQVRGGLGHLAALLPPEETFAALRSYTANRQHSPQARVTAALIAERYLNTEVPSALLSDLHNSDEIAFQSLREALDESHRNRHVLLEYVTQMQAMGEEIAAMVLNLLDRVPAVDRIELLRLIAQDKRERVASAALTRLENLTAGEASAAAVRALHTLHFTLPAELSAHADRTLRKLRFSGKRYLPPSSDLWRALLSPADATGNQSVWIVKMPEPGAKIGVLLGFALNLNEGILHFFGSETMERSVLPDPQPIGQLVTVGTDDGGTAVLLEAPFEYGRWLIWTALAKPQGEPVQALTGEYTLYNDLLWQFDAPQVEESVKLFFQKNPLPAEALAAPILDAYAAALLAHPAMEHWQLQNRTHFPAADANVPTATLVAVMLHELAQWPEHATLLNALAAGLRAQAGWFHYAGDLESAHQAHMLAEQMPQLPLAQNLLLTRMVAAGVRAGK